MTLTPAMSLIQDDWVAQKIEQTRDQAWTKHPETNSCFDVTTAVPAGRRAGDLGGAEDACETTVCHGSCRNAVSFGRPAEECLCEAKEARTTLDAGAVVLALDHDGNICATWNAKAGPVTKVGSGREESERCAGGILLWLP